MAGTGRALGSIMLLCMVLGCSAFVVIDPVRVIGDGFTRADSSVVFNGTIPVLLAYEDNASSGEDLIDLAEYVWDPDGGPLDFSVNRSGIEGPRPWSLVLNSSIVSFVPGSGSENWNGTFTYPLYGNGSGQDLIWDTIDDVSVEFNLTLTVLPVNDAPELLYIKVDGDNIRPGLFQHIEFRVDVGEELVCDLIWADPDGDEVSVGLVDPSGYGIIVEDEFTFSPKKAGSYTVKFNVSDGSVSVLYLMHFKAEVPSGGGGGDLEDRVFLGLSFDGSTVHIPVIDGQVNITLYEGEEIAFLFMFDRAGVYSFQDTGEPVPLDIYEMEGYLGPFVVPHGGDNGTMNITWSELNGTSGNFKIYLELIDVNTDPEEVQFFMVGDRYKGEEITFYFTWADPDLDALTYTIDFGDGSGQVQVYGSPVIHRYERTGKMIMHIQVIDGYGGYASSSHYVNITEKAPERPDVTVESQDDMDAVYCILLAAILLGFPIILVVLLSLSKRSGIQRDTGSISPRYSDSPPQDPMKEGTSSTDPMVQDRSKGGEITEE